MKPFDKDVEFSDVVKDLRSFELAVKGAVDGTLTGVHRSAVTGASVEFSQHRPYTPGDDLKRVDWKTYARSDRFHLKEFEDETNTRVYLCLDQSSSMNYGNAGRTKFQTAQYLAGCLGYYFQLQNDLISLARFGESFQFIPPRSNRPHLRLVLDSLRTALPAGKGNVQEALEELRRVIHRRSVVILISDFLNCDLTLLDSVARSFLSGKHHMLWMKVSDPSEHSLPAEGFLNLEGLEGEEPLRLQTAGVRDLYERAYQRFSSDIENIALQRKSRFIDISTNHSMSEILRRVSA